jgi:hypothetical protein
MCSWSNHAKGRKVPGSILVRRTRISLLKTYRQASYSVVTMGCFLGGNVAEAGCWPLTSEPMFKMNVAIIILPLYACVLWKRQIHVSKSTTLLTVMNMRITVKSRQRRHTPCKASYIPFSVIARITTCPYIYNDSAGRVNASHPKPTALQAVSIIS